MNYEEGVTELPNYLFKSNCSHLLNIIVIQKCVAIRTLMKVENIF